MTSVGFWMFWRTFATVNVFPEPVTPRSVWNLEFCFRPSVNCLIASGCEPSGLNSDSSSNLSMSMRIN